MNQFAGFADNMFLEHGLVHWQTYSGNLRYQERPGGMKVTVCDWDRSRDTTGMSYKQAFGYILDSQHNMLQLALDTQRRGIPGLTKPDLVGAAIEGFQMMVSGFEDRERPIDPELLDKAKESATRGPGGPTTSGRDTEVSMLYSATIHMSGADIPHPFTEYIKHAYPPEKHKELQERYR